MKRTLYLLIAISAMLIFNSCGHKRECIALFKKSFTTQDSVEQKKIWEDVITKFPESEQANYCRAALMGRPAFRERIRLLNEAIKENPDFAEAYNLRGLLKLERRFYKFALQDFITASSIDKEYAEAFYNKANLYRIYRSMPEAMGAYDTALMLKPDFSEAWLNRGVANDIWGHYKEAILDFNKAIELSPDNTEIWLDRGIVKGKLKDYKGSLEDLKSALKLNPAYGKAWQNKGITEYMAGMTDSACVSWKKAADLGVADASKAIAKYCK
ncbi:MAG: tetratricopeptide repeat protein [Bacteroidota bacterium]